MEVGDIGANSRLIRLAGRAERDGVQHRGIPTLFDSETTVSLHGLRQV